MATTTWIVGSGDWNDASNWSDGVPTDVDLAMFTASSGGTITGNGIAAAITLAGDSTSDVFSGNHDTGTLTIGESDYLTLATLANLSFDSLNVDGGVLQLGDGSQLRGGQIKLFDGIVTGATTSLNVDFGVITTPIELTGEDGFAGVGSLSGAITGTGSIGIYTPYYYDLTPTEVTLSGAAEAYTGLIQLDSSTVDLPGSNDGTDTILANGSSIVNSGTRNLEIFDVSSGLAFNQTSGRATIIGAIGPTALPPDLELKFTGFGQLSISGGAGSVTVFGGDESGTIYGGSAGNNVVVAGASATSSLALFPTSPVTIVGGGSGDLLVVTGRLNNLIVASVGNETLTGGGASGNNTFFGGPGSDEIVAGAGQDTVVAGSGCCTVFGGSGGTAIFAEAGTVLAVGGTASDYIQVGTGSSTFFTGSGGDLIGVVNGQSGGKITVIGFRAGVDHVSTRGFTTFSASSIGGNTILTLPDQTSVTLVGVNSLPASVFA